MVTTRGSTQRQTTASRSRSQGRRTNSAARNLKAVQARPLSVSARDKMGSRDITPQAEAPSAPFIARFYREEGLIKDHKGRKLADILSFNNKQLERKHDYIQYLFPLPEPSPFNVIAPTVTKPVREAFLEDSHLRDQLFKAFERMAAFYGFDIVIKDNGYDFVPKSNFAALASATWLKGDDHNHQRITRIIRCLRILGLEPLALAFYHALVEVDARSPVIDKLSLRYWERAALRPLHLPPNQNDNNAAGIVWLRDVVPA